MLPGQYAIVVGSEGDAQKARAEGWSLRDTVVIWLPGAVVKLAFLFRAPLEGTVAENVLKHRTGGLWIDGCRVGTTKRAPGGLSRTRGLSLSGSIEGTLRRETGRESGHNPNIGRWPPNLLLVHGPGCVSTGLRRVKGSGGSRKVTPKTAGHVYAQDTYTRTRMTHSIVRHDDPNGTEEVPAWDCQSDCPVRLLDEQAGSRHPRGNKNPTVGGGGLFGHRVITYQWQAGEGVEGVNASRFFPQFEDMTGALEWLHQLAGTSLAE